MWSRDALQVGWQPSSANRTSFLQRFKSTYVAPYYEVRCPPAPPNLPTVQSLSCAPP